MAFDPMAAFLDSATITAIKAQHTRNVTDLSAETSGGNAAALDASANVNAPDDAVMVMRVAAGIVIASLIALYVLGAIVLKGV